jgi:hypothetical protein
MTWSTVDLGQSERRAHWSLSSWSAPGVEPQRDGLGSMRGTQGSLLWVKGGSAAVELTRRRWCPPVGGAP